MDKKTVAIAILSLIILVAGGLSWMSPGTDSEKHTGGSAERDDTQMNWYLADFHIHPWNSDTLDSKFSKDYFESNYPGESYAAYDGIATAEHSFPDVEELDNRIGYINANYPGKFYVIGGHFDAHIGQHEVVINVFMPYANIAALPSRYYDDSEFEAWEEITRNSYRYIVEDVHSVGGLIIWAHPLSAEGIDAWNDMAAREELTNVVDGIELASLEGPGGAGTLKVEDIQTMWDYFSPYVDAGELFVLGVTDYSVTDCNGRPECLGVEWYNNNYGSMIKAYSTDDASIFDALRDKRVVMVLNRTSDNKTYCYGKAEWVADLSNSVPCN